jgi:hypothetical protein
VFTEELTSGEVVGGALSEVPEEQAERRAVSITRASRADKIRFEPVLRCIVHLLAQGNFRGTLWYTIFILISMGTKKPFIRRAGKSINIFINHCKTCSGENGIM